MNANEDALRHTARLPAVLPERLGVSSLARLWGAATETIGSDFPWAVATSARLDELGLFGYSVQTAPTADASIGTACRLFELISQGPRPSRVASDTLIFGTPHPRTMGERTIGEAVLAHFAHMSIQAAPELRIVKLILQRRLRRDDRIRELGVTIVDDAHTNAVVYDAKTLHSPTRFAHPSLHAYLRAPSERALRALGRIEDDLLSRVITIIERQIADSPRLADVAAELDMSPRTLRRRLVDRGWTFRRLVDDLRRRSAVDLMSHDERSLTDISAALGYSELSAFSRAYRSWFGTTPLSASKRK